MDDFAAFGADDGVGFINDVKYLGAFLGLGKSRQLGEFLPLGQREFLGAGGVGDGEICTNFWPAVAELGEEIAELFAALAEAATDEGIEENVVAGRDVGGGAFLKGDDGGGDLRLGVENGGGELAVVADVPAAGGADGHGAVFLRGGGGGEASGDLVLDGENKY